ncbi:MAG TPA: DUF559 domain-containing protein [Allosphingosinicella sp.]|jgi:very-short-patch-repair endonuclease
MTGVRLSPHLAPGQVRRARALRREMTPAERALRAGLRASFPHIHLRYQVPLGPYYAHIACHAARLVIELDGSQHHAAAIYDAERTAFLNAQGYRVLRFWNNQVLQDLDSVLTAIAPHLPSPLVGEGAPKGRMGGAGHRPARAERRAPPTPPSPTRGEGFEDNLSVGVK